MLWTIVRGELIMKVLIGTNKIGFPFKPKIVFLLLIEITATFLFWTTSLNS